MESSVVLAHAGGVAVGLGIGWAVVAGCGAAAADSSSPAPDVDQRSAPAAASPHASSAPARRVTSARPLRSARSLSPAAAATPRPPAAQAGPRVRPVSGRSAPLAGLLKKIRVTLFNRTPTITYDAAGTRMQPDGTITGTVVGFDPDGDTLTYSVGQPAHGGSVSIDGSGHFTYVPGPDFDAAGRTDLFTATVSDAGAGFHIHGLLGLLAPGRGSTASTSVEVSGWGPPVRTTYFGDPSALASNVYVYDGPSNEGNRTPSAISFADGVMVFTGDADGNTAGMAWGPGQQYGAWEVRARVPAGAANYNAALLLWPDAENWPTGGEIDFMEIQNDAARQHVGAALHYSAANKWITGSVAVDATQWHVYSVVWTPSSITTYVDGVAFFTTTDTSKFPPGSMHLCLQLDVAGPDIGAGARMEVAWAKQYSLASIS